MGGPTHSCIGMAEAVAARGHDVRICTTDLAPASADGPVPIDQPVKRNGVTYYYYHWPSFTFMAYAPGMIAALPRLVGDVDAVHIHSLYLAHCWATARTARAQGVPYLVRPHGTLDPYIYQRRRFRKSIVEALFQNRVNRHAAAMHYTTEEEMRLASPYVPGTPGVVVPLGLDPARYASPPLNVSLRSRWPEIGNRPILLFYSRLNFKKGLDILIQAFARTLAAGHDWHLVLAGPDHGMEEKVRGWVAEAGLGERTTFTGMLEGDIALAALHEADLFILPSLSENFGVSVIEAMACGTPVLISDRVNIWREAQADGAAMVAPPTVDDTEKMMVAAMTDPAARAAMGEAGRASVSRRYTWSKVGAKLESVYEEIIGGRAADPDSVAAAVS